MVNIDEIQGLTHQDIDSCKAPFLSLKPVISCYREVPDHEPRGINGVAKVVADRTAALCLTTGILGIVGTLELLGLGGLVVDGPRYSFVQLFCCCVSRSASARTLAVCSRCPNGALSPLLSRLRPGATSAAYVSPGVGGDVFRHGLNACLVSLLS